MGNHTAVRGRGRFSGGGSGGAAGKGALSRPSAAAAQSAQSAPAASTVPVVYHDPTTARATATRLFGHPLTDADVASLVGAQRGDQVEVYGSRTELDIHLIGANYAYDAGREVRRGADGRPMLSNQFFVVADEAARGHGMGTRVFADQVRAAQRLGISHIETMAVRDAGYNGYYTWARLGYNADIPSRLVSRLPPSLAGARTLHDLMRTPEGRTWWKVNGITTDMTFDLTPGSDSMQMLEAYLRGRGIA